MFLENVVVRKDEGYWIELDILLFSKLAEAFFVVIFSMAKG